MRSGLALGRPDKRVIVLDGDGSLLMNLGTLVTTAEAAPKNLFHFVCENGTYEANGGHPIPGRGSVSFAGMARSAGYKSVYEFSDLKIFEQQVGAILAEQGPVFVCLKIVSSGDAGARLQPPARPACAQGLPRRAGGGLSSAPGASCESAAPFLPRCWRRSFPRRRWRRRATRRTGRSP